MGLEILDTALDDAIGAGSPKSLGRALGSARFDAGVEIAEWLDHDLKDLEELRRCSLGINFWTVFGYNLLPVCVLEVKRDVAFSPSAGEYFKVINGVFAVGRSQTAGILAIRSIRISVTESP